MAPPQKPLYTGPMFPLGSQVQGAEDVQRLQGTVVGVCADHNGKVGTTRVLTIQLAASHPEGCELLHSDVEIVIRPKR
jgi:hypothetical protein